MRRVLAVALLGAIAISCNDIESRRRSTAPLNASTDFPCERYADTRAVPSEGRCIVTGQTLFDFTILVNVPETSQYAAGHTFVLKSADLSRAPDPACTERNCLLMPALANVIGGYQVTRAVSDAVQSEPPLADGQSIPVRATYEPVIDDLALPLDVVFASSRIVDLDSPTVGYVRSLPAGTWTRTLQPAPPFDQYFPPYSTVVTVKRGGTVFDPIEIGGVSGGLDDPTGTSRDAVVTRAEGLDGWKVWLQDHASGRRISTVKTLTDLREERPRLDTIGRGTSLEGVDAIVAPPESWVGVPRLVVELIAGSGLSKLAYPELRAPVPLEGIVAASEAGGVFLAVASRVTFLSKSVTLPSGIPQPLLQYSATVSTDDRGRFATVLPPGTYDVTIEPLEGSGFASFKKQVVIADKSPITLSPPRRTRVRGHALLTDGRALSNAEVLAVAEPRADTTAQPRPRPARTRVAGDGSFAFDLDQGAHVFTIIPEAGTGFPRVLSRVNVAVGEADIGVLRIPPPTELTLEIRRPPDATSPANPISSAHVRIFATPEGAAGPGLEIGNGMTNAVGKVEILLAQQPK